MNTLEQKIDQMAQSIAILLTEQLKTNIRLDSMENKINNVERIIKTDLVTKNELNNLATKDDLNSLATKKEFNSIQNEVFKGFKEIGEMISYVGNKVFDNHESRIKTLEQKMV